MSVNHTSYGRQKRAEVLSVEDIVVAPTEALDELETSLVRIGEDGSETPEWRSATTVRVRIVRPKCAFKGEPERGIISMLAPDAPLS